MSLDTPNAYIPKYEKQDESDRDMREIKIDINTYFMVLNFVKKWIIKNGY